MLHQYDIEFVDVLQAGSMRVDGNRNIVVREFLQTDADWLFWVDADNINPVASIRRLLDTAGDAKTLVSGIYYTKESNPHPVAYVEANDPSSVGRYRHLYKWERGEIIPIEAAGMNCCLSHRSVYEDIDKNYVALRLETGGDIAVHREDIIGDVFITGNKDTDNKVIDGVWNFRVFLPEEPINVPMFELRFQRTEDMGFFEKAKRSGHSLFLDTSVECGHLHHTMITGKDYREGSNSRHWGRSDSEGSLGESEDHEPDWLTTG